MRHGMQVQDQTRPLRHASACTALMSCLGAALLGCGSTPARQPTASAGDPVSPPETPAKVDPPPSDEALPSSGKAERVFAFDGDQAGAVPSGFTFGRTGKGAIGKWLVRAESDAPSSPNVLAQLDADDTSFRFPVAVAASVSFANGRLSARCKMISGRVDQACGLVFRYRDENNYYITRANALEGNIRLYYVKDGEREEIASHDGKVTANTWHEYAVEAQGDRFRIFWDGKQVLDHRDDTFGAPGGVGCWTKADSVTYFDDLRAVPSVAP
jgi:hypothetical protein